LVVAVRRCTKLHPKLQWRPERVEGHKDKELPFKELTELQQLNVLADEQAKVHLRQHTEGHEFQPPQLQVDLNPWSVWIDGRTLAKNLKPELREHCSGQLLKEHWTSRGCFGGVAAEDVDWEAAHGAMKAFNKGQ
jgi:hypothetical protein